MCCYVKNYVEQILRVKAPMLQCCCLVLCVRTRLFKMQGVNQAKFGHFGFPYCIFPKQCAYTLRSLVNSIVLESCFSGLTPTSSLSISSENRSFPFLQEKKRQKSVRTTQSLRSSFESCDFSGKRLAFRHINAALAFLQESLKPSRQKGRDLRQQPPEQLQQHQHG